MLDFLQSVDAQWLIAVNSLAGNHLLDQIMILLSSKFSSIPLYALLAYFLWSDFGLANFGWIILSVVSLVVITDQGSVYLFKEVFERLRPCHDSGLIEQINLVTGRCGGQYGFISSHASNVFGLTSLLLSVFQNRTALKTTLILWATMVSFSRVYLGVHFPFDVIAGAVFGLSIGAMFGQILKNQILTK